MQVLAGETGALCSTSLSPVLGSNGGKVLHLIDFGTTASRHLQLSCVCVCFALSSIIFLQDHSFGFAVHIFNGSTVHIANGSPIPRFYGFIF